MSETKKMKRLLITLVAIVLLLSLSEDGQLGMEMSIDPDRLHQDHITSFLEDQDVIHNDLIPACIHKICRSCLSRSVIPFVQHALKIIFICRLGGCGGISW